MQSKSQILVTARPPLWPPCRSERREMFFHRYSELMPISAFCHMSQCHRTAKVQHLQTLIGVPGSETAAAFPGAWTQKGAQAA